ncbi:MAG: sugar ABC transporter permease [Candidatus Bathyarchaeia archaeon]
MKKVAPSPFLLPSILFLLAMAIYPLSFNIYISFHNWDLRTGEVVFVGIHQYSKLLNDERFLNALKNTVIFVISAVSLEFTIGLIYANILNQELKGKRVFRTIFLLPMMLTPIVIGYVFLMFYHGDVGVVNHLLDICGLPKVNWLGSTSTSLLSAILVDVWQYSSMMILILLAGLQSLPTECLEAAEVDGASRWRVFKDITMPLMKPVMAVAILIRSVDAFKIFDIIYILTEGGPGTSSEPITMYAIWEGFRYFNIGYGAAIAMSLVALTSIITSQLLRVLRWR